MQRIRFLRNVDVLVLDQYGVTLENHYRSGDVIDVQVIETDSADMVKVKFGRNTATMCLEDVEFLN